MQAKPEEIETVVSTALECGYRHIDTAANYNNEDAIGRALKKWFEKGGTREELFITTKVMYCTEFNTVIACNLLLNNYNVKLFFKQLYLENLLMLLVTPFWQSTI